MKTARSSEDLLNGLPAGVLSIARKRGDFCIQVDCVLFLRSTIV
jgi:hypothetical protein